MMGIFNWISSLGAWALSGVRTLGNFSRFLFRLVVNLGPSFTRFQGTVKQLYFVGNYSLVIILVSGLFVGFVLGLQGDYVLSSYGSEQALGVLVALSLLRELGPVVTALLFAGRAGTSLTAEIGLMNAGEQLSALEMMGVDGLRHLDAAACDYVLRRRHYRQLGCGCPADRIGFRRLLGADAGRR